MKILRPYYLKNKDAWIIAYKMIDDPPETPWKIFSEQTYYMLDMAKLVITLLVKYTVDRFIAYEYLNLDEFEIDKYATKEKTL